MAEWFVYMIQTEDHLLYTGITTDIERRFKEHLHSAKGARFFRAHKPRHIVYRESSADRASASKREYEIKQLSRKEKLRLTRHYKASEH